jgi:hypothetical protein
MHEPAECRNVAEPLAIDDTDAKSDTSSHELAYAHADRAPVVRAAQRAVGHGRVGARGGNETLPFV